MLALCFGGPQTPSEVPGKYKGAMDVKCEMATRDLLMLDDVLLAMCSLEPSHQLMVAYASNLCSTTRYELEPSHTGCSLRMHR
jgi:hypothetical protein